MKAPKPYATIRVISTLGGVVAERLTGASRRSDGPQRSGVPAEAVISVQVYRPFHPKVSTSWLRRVARSVLSLAPGPHQVAGSAGPLALVLADDETVRELNRRYRGLDEVTDVLAFSPSHQGHYEGEEEPPPLEAVPFPDVGLGQEPLGDVVISYPQAERQAAEAGHPVQTELANLVIHGILHLLCHDHSDPEEERLMLARQQEALEQAPPEARVARRHRDS